MYKVAILYICTGKYDVLWEEFYLSFKEKFLLDSKVEYFVFTDAKEIKFEHNEDVHKMYQENLGWPDNTLRRFDIFLRIKDTILKYDFVYFFNANMYCNKVITEREFLPLAEGENLVMVQHAGCAVKERKDYPYETNPKSLAYIPDDKGEYYVMGSLNGGKSANYMDMVETLSINTEKDWQKGIVAVWHDESHLNQYLIGRDDVKILPPSFCAVEGIEYPFEIDMLLREKNRYFDVEAVKANSFVGRFQLYADRLKSKIAFRSRVKKVVQFFGKD